MSFTYLIYTIDYLLNIYPDSHFPFLVVTFSNSIRPIFLTPIKWSYRKVNQVATRYLANCQHSLSLIMCLSTRVSSCSLHPQNIVFQIFQFLVGSYVFNLIYCDLEWHPFIVSTVRSKIGSLFKSCFCAHHLRHSYKTTCCITCH